MNNTQLRRKTHLLLILDGWGHSTTAENNAIAQGNTPTWDRLLNTYPNSLISGSGTDVGLPDGQMGNSEVGHVNMGAGRVVYQDYTRINKSIEEDKLRSNTTLSTAIKNVANMNKPLHIMGLLSPGGVHSHENHLYAILDLAAHLHAQKVYLHLFLDGRDTPPKSAHQSLTRLDTKLKSLTAKGIDARVLTICGRYYAMDRDQRWDRVQLAYEAITQQKADYRYDTAEDALNAAYERGESDEFVQPTLVGTSTDTQQPINHGDALIFFNFRSDRARQITEAFTSTDFTGFDRSIKPELSHFVMMTKYADYLQGECAFPVTPLNNTLPEVLAEQEMTQLRIAETEKYAHVTFFFNGGKEAQVSGEDRLLIPSPNVKTYDLQPEMSLPEVTEKLCAAIKSGKYDMIVCNFANGDMVGHTGNFEAALQAAHAVDRALREVEQAVLESNSECLITADHGNIEQMMNKEGSQPHTAHTCNPVPLIYLGQAANIKPNGKLSDLAPTLLSLMNLEIPTEMTGTPLIEKITPE